MNRRGLFNISKYYTAGIIAIFIFSCKQEIVFPDPGFDIKSNREVEVRRDTADFYDIQLAMDVPNGVEKIEVLNGTDYTPIVQITEHKGKTKFDFVYRVDISEIVIDTTLSFIIKVIDKDNRSFNRGFVIKVLKFSIPEVFLTGGNTIAVVAPSYILKGEVTTGMYPIDSIMILFEGVLQTILVPDSLVTEYQLNETVYIGNLDPAQEYLLQIIVVDSRGERSATNVTVIKGVFEQPRRIVYKDNRMNREHTFDFHYNTESRLDSFVFVWNSGGISQSIYQYYLNYDANGNVTEIGSRTYVTAFPDEGYYWFHFRNIFYYVDGTSELVKISSNEIRYFDSGLTEDEGEEVLAQQFVYREDGTVSSYVGARYVTDIQYADGFGAGEKIFAEYWYSYPFNEIIDQNRRRRTGFDPVFMPTYIYGLPPFLLLHRSHMVLFNDLFMHQYVFTGTELYDPFGAVSPLNYTYTSDEQGRLVKFSRIETNNGSEVIYDYYIEY